MDRSSRHRDPAEHAWPALNANALMAPGTARSKSASANTILADFPPSSSPTGIIRSAATFPIAIPTRTEPVKEILRTASCATIAAPASSPVSRHDVQYAWWQGAFLSRNTGQFHKGGRRVFGRFCDNCIACGQGRRDPAPGLVQRSVPRQDDADNPKRLMSGHVGYRSGIQSQDR